MLNVLFLRLAAIILSVTRRFFFFFGALGGSFPASSTDSPLRAIMGALSRHCRNETG